MNARSGFIGFLLCFVAGALAMWGVGVTRPSAGEVIDNPATWDDRKSSIPVSSDDPSWGSRTAPVTLVLFSDYMCPYCKRLEDTIGKLKKTYGPHKLRIVFKHAPIVHKKARPAHEAAAAAFIVGGADKYWAFHHLAFDNGASPPNGSFDPWAKEVGGLEGFHDAAIEQRAKDKVDQDLALAKSLRVQGTPMSFINGRLIAGNQNIDEFTRAIDDELVETGRLLASGTPPDELYVVRSLQNKPLTADTKPTASADAKPEAPAPQKDRGATQEDDRTVFRALIGASPVLGPADAPVTIVEFANFECRFSSQSEEGLKEIMNEYKGKVRLVFKHRMLPYLKRGLPAALVAELARADKGDDAFWAAHDALFAAEAKAQETGNKDFFSPDALVAIGAGLGLDPAKLKAIVADADPKTPVFEPGPAAKKLMAAVDADGELADVLDAEATPHFFINGRRLVGAQGPDKIKMAVDEELKKAEATIASGTQRAAFYDKLMETAKEPEPPPTKLIDPATPGTPWRGNEHAQVEVHVFSDFECPFCKQVTTTLGVIEAMYSDRVKFVWHDRPLSKHELAPLAANAAREALAQKGNAGFWAYHDGLFALTKTPDFTRAGFEALAEKQGLDMTAFRAALDTKPYSAKIEDEVKRADENGITGTPSFVFTYKKEGEKLEGYFLSGALAPSKFRRAIKLALLRTAKTG